MTVRVRGIYATALTALVVDDGHDVVGASLQIRERFDTDAVRAAGVPDVVVRTTDDRLGVLLVGGADPVATLATRLRDVAVDIISWPVAARDAVFDVRVSETTGDGAVCPLPDGDSGLLPFDAADGRIETGDRYRVQVSSPAPPWTDRRPRLATTLRARAGPAVLRRGDGGVRADVSDPETASELAGLVDLLGADVPDGWGLRWQGTAADADLETLESALAGARRRALALEDALPETVDPQRRIHAPLDAVAVLFGRLARFELDDRRRAVVPTMPGHHRTKAIAGASAGVDLAEAVAATFVDEFPFDGVASAFGPRVGDRVSIEHGKPAGHTVTLGRGEVTERTADGGLTVRRELSGGGTYDGLGVTRESGDVALTNFEEGRWWYPTVYRTEGGDRKGTYVNVCTPVECFPDAVRYVDLHVDVVKGGDGRVDRLDDDELAAAVDAGQLPAALAERAREVAASVERALR